MKNKEYPYYEAGTYDTLNEFLEYITKKNSDKIAFKYLKNKKDVEKTYKAFHDDVISLSKKMLQLSYSNINIGVLGENSYEWILSYFATIVSGNVVVPVDKELPIDEIINLMKEAEIKVLMVSSTYDDYFQKLKETFEDLKIIEFNSIDKFINEGKKIKISLPKIEPNKVSTIIFTSGTTSKPKGVMLTHKSLTYDSIACQKHFILTGDTVLVLPLHHTFAFTANILFALTCRICYMYSK